MDSKSNSQYTVLTVEDDEFVREIITVYLEDSGFSVLQAENGRKGLELFRSKQPDLVLLDLRMPEIDGLEVLATVTKEAVETPVIVVSGMGTIGDAIKALKYGAWDYISKPIHDMAVLEHAVNKALERAKLLRENRQYRERLEEQVRERTQQLEQRTVELEELSESLKLQVDKCERAEEVVRKVNIELKTLSDCNHAVVRAVDETQLIADMCRIIVKVGGYALVWVGFAEHDAASTIRLVHCEGREEGSPELGVLSWADKDGSSCPMGTAIRSGVPVIEKNSSEAPAFLPWGVGESRLPYGSLISLPLMSRHQVIGCLTIYADACDDAFGGEEEKLLLELADDMAYGIVALRSHAERDSMSDELQINVEKLRTALEGTVQVVASTVEVRDPYTAGHQRRVALLARAIAEEMGLSDNQINGVFMAGVVHDLGKIYVPAEILSKPKQLNDLEFNLIKTHPQVGYDLLKTIEFPWPIAQIVYQHHERLDGTGYPSGLAGEDIMIEARILAVADVVEAMASHRPYRPSRGMSKALSEISDQQGTLYDQQVVDACLKLFEIGFTFEE